MNHKCASNNSNKTTQRQMVLVSFRNAVIWLVGKVTNQIILQNFPDYLNEVKTFRSRWDVRRMISRLCLYANPVFTPFNIMICDLKFDFVTQMNGFLTVTVTELPHQCVSLPQGLPLYQQNQTRFNMNKRHFTANRFFIWIVFLFSKILESEVFFQVSF